MPYSIFLEERDLLFTVTLMDSTVPEIFLLSDVFTWIFFTEKRSVCLPLKSPFLNYFFSLISFFIDLKNLEPCLRVLPVSLLGSQQLGFGRWFLQ